MTSFAGVAPTALATREPAILIMTSFATELATPSVTDVRTDTLPCLIYKDNATKYFTTKLHTGRRVAAKHRDRNATTHRLL